MELVRCRDCGAQVARGDAFVAFEVEFRCAACNEAAWERHYDRMDDPPAAPVNDIAEWGEKDTSGAYEPGTTFTINGREFDPAEADAIVDGPDAGE